MNLITRTFAAASLALTLAAPATAGVTYLFEQQGFDGGGKITGSFTGTDLDGSGFLEYYEPSLGGATELTAFELHFTGDASVSAFSLSLADLQAFVYEIGSGVLGDGTEEGMLAISLSGAAELYVGMSVASMPGALVAVGSDYSQSNQTLAVRLDSSGPTELPEPDSLTLLAAALLAAGLSRHLSTNTPKASSALVKATVATR